MKKKIFFILAIILFIFFATSCSVAKISTDENINFAILIDKSGQITQEISIPTQEDEIGFSAIEKERYIKELAMEIKTKLFFPYFVNFYTTSVLKGREEYRMGGGKANYELPQYNPKTKTIGFSFSFDDTEVWNFYHETENKSDGLTVEKGLLVNKGTTKNPFIFSQEVVIEGKEQTLGEYFYSILSSAQSKHAVEEKQLSKPGFSYTYKVGASKIHTNADSRYKEEEGYVNVWQASFDDLSTEKTVEIYVYNPNRANWYVFALGLTVILMAVIFVLHVFKKKKWRCEGKKHLNTF